jgi:t-SNARE complex subunit (syntaxin)
LQERRREAEAIAKEAVEVNVVMKDLSGLVHEQGETINKVEENVTTSRDTVIKGNQELEKAAEYQRSYRRKCCFFWIIFLIVVGIALAIIVPLVVKASQESNSK